MRELEPQVNEGGDDTVGERQVVVRAGAGGRLALVSPAAAQPVFPGFDQGPDSSPVSLASVRRRSPVQIRCDKAVRAHLDDTSRSFRAAAHVPGADTPQTPAMPQKSYRAPSRKGLRIINTQVSWLLVRHRFRLQESGQVCRGGNRAVAGVIACPRSSMSGRVAWTASVILLRSTANSSARTAWVQSLRR